MLSVLNEQHAQRTNISVGCINDGGTLKLIEIGANDSGGAGYKMLRIAN